MPDIILSVSNRMRNRGQSLSVSQGFSVTPLPTFWANAFCLIILWAEGGEGALSCELYAVQQHHWALFIEVSI